MAISFLYRDLDATDTDVTPYVVLRFGSNPDGMSENAEERSVGAWDLQIEDDGVLDLHAQRTFYVLEDDTPDADNVLWVGQTFDKHSTRGDVFRTGPGRVYTLSLIDLNTLLERRLIQEGDSPNRPAETDVERMQWLEGLGYIGGPSDYLSTADPVDMDAVDYTLRMASEVIEDCMGQSGKNAFMFRDPDNNIFSTFYGDSSADTDVLTSDIRLSNVLSDVDNVTTWEALLDADQWEANSRIYSGLGASYDGGAIYQENATTVANFSHRDTTVSWPDVKSEAKAIARAIRYLADIGTEEIRITAQLEVESNQVGLMPHAGYRMQVRFSHFPLFAEEFVWMRILSRQTTLIAPQRYRIKYELSPGTPPPPALSCSTALAAVTVYQPGNLPIPCHNWSDGPLSQAVSLSPSVPSVIVAIMAASECSFNPGDFNALASPYTEIGSSHVNGGMAGYRANTTDGNTFSMSFTGGDASYQVLLAVAIPTAATGAVQVARQVGGGSTATFSSDLTPGNLVISACSAERNIPSDIDGWFTLANDGSQLGADALHGRGVTILARCIQEGDDPRVVPVPNPATTHNAWCMEIEIV